MPCDLAALRRLALGLPEVEEGTSYGTVAFRVRGKLFLRQRDDDEEVFVVRVADLAEKEALVAAAPERFFTLPHYDGHASVLVRLAAIDEDELSELIAQAWLVRAPVRLRRAWESGGGA